MNNTVFRNPLIAVADLKRSEDFYHDLFDMNVAVDLGWCVTLTGGLTIQLNFDILAGFSKEKIVQKPYDMELYFEAFDFDDFILRLNKMKNVELLHEPKKYPWLQRVVRFFDPDGHMIEVGEAMEAVGFSLFREGKTIDEVVTITQHPLGLVKTWKRHFDKKEQQK